jgi:hypothetical protein
MKIMFRAFTVICLLSSFLPQIAAAFSWVDRDDWAGIYFNNKKLGFSHSKMTIKDDEILINSRIYFRVKVGDVNQVTSFAQESRLDKNLKVKSFSLLQEIMGNRQKIEGAVKNGDLQYEVNTLDYTKKYSKPFSKADGLSSTVFLNMLQGGLKVGKKGSFQIFVEPFQIMKTLNYKVLKTIEMKVDGLKQQVFVIKQKYVGVESMLWVTGNGTLVRELSQNGMESRRESSQQAQNLGNESVSVSSFITLSLVKTDKPVKNPDDKKHLKIQLSNLKVGNIVPSDHRQSVLNEIKQKNGTYNYILEVKAETSKLSKSLNLPISNHPDKSLLEETSEIQSKHPMIRALARDLVEEKKNAWSSAKIINMWVYDNMEKTLVDSFTALHALKARKGECQSHANLFTAIARAAGIPTRVVNGLVYSSQFKGFVYHAWTEVFVGEWRALDPTFGQEIVDATHIKLAEGGYEGAVRLMEFIGKVKIDIL